MTYTALSPNLEAPDVKQALLMIFKPWRWRHGSDGIALDKLWQHYFPDGKTIFTNSGRSALLILLQSLQLKATDEVLLQAFTCTAVPNPIRWSNATPVYVDIDEATLNMSVADLERKITPRSKVLIIQHTFGNPAALSELINVARKHSLFVIEDCAHALGAKFNNKYLGTFGDAAIFSFGRDKVISSVYGGALLLNTGTLNISPLPFPSRLWTLQQLLHPLISYLAKALPWILPLAQKAKLISLAVSKIERAGLRPNYFPAALPNALAALAVTQIKRLEKFNNHRQTIAAFYHQNLPTNHTWVAESIWLRYSVIVNDPKYVFDTAKKHGVILGDWYWSALAPDDGRSHIFGYVAGSCPVAEDVAHHIINLPTHIGIRTAEAKKIVAIIKPYVN